MESYNELPGIHSHISKIAAQPTSADDLHKIISYAGIDCRVRLFAILAATLPSFLLKSEITLLIMAVFVVVWLCVLRQIRTAIIFTVIYAAFYLLQRINVTDMAIGSILMVLSIFRRFMLTAFIAMPLGKAPTGVLISSLSKMHVPRQVTIALAVMFRFMPTVAEEYNAIRSSQKFRGIGISGWGLLRHPVRSYETILVPLLIRTTKIADELSASAILRGASVEGEVSSFRTVRLTHADCICLIIIAILSAGLLALDLLWR